MGGVLTWVGLWLCGTTALGATSSGQRLAGAADRSTFESMAFSRDGHLFAAGMSDGWIGIWALPGGRLVRTISAFPYAVSDLEFSGDGAYLVAGLDCCKSILCRGSGWVSVWEVATGRYLHSVNLTYSPPTVAVLDGGKSILVAGGRQDLWRLSLPSLEREAAFRSPGAGDAEVSGLVSMGGGRAVVATDDHAIYLVSTEAGATLKSGRVSDDGPVALLTTCLASAPRQGFVIVADETSPEITQWFLDGKTPQREWQALRPSDQCVFVQKLSLDAQCDLALCVDDSPTARVWQVGTGGLVRELPGAQCAAFHPMQPIIAYATDIRGVRLLDYALREPAGELPTGRGTALTVANGTGSPITVYIRGPFSEMVTIPSERDVTFEGIPAGKYRVHADGSGELAGRDCTVTATVGPGRLTVTCSAESE